jgi:CheY-like chemotaxis protein
MNLWPLVLIVEDLEIWQDVLSEVLIDAGYRVCIASTYSSAMQALAENNFDLAVIDPVLDDANRRNRDGLRVLEQILDQQPDTAAVVVTSSDPTRIQREVHAMSPTVRLLWKDEWDDERFLSIVDELIPNAREFSEL